MTTTYTAPDIGDDVTLAGRIVGRSQFIDGRDSYLVEFDQKGKTKRDWFHAADFLEEDDDAE